LKVIVQSILSVSVGETKEDYKALWCKLKKSTDKDVGIQEEKTESYAAVGEEKETCKKDRKRRNQTNGPSQMRPCAFLGRFRSNGLIKRDAITGTSAQPNQMEKTEKGGTDQHNGGGKKKKKEIGKNY